MPAQAGTFSLQVRGGGGPRFTQLGVTAFLYEAQVFDLFAGGDFTQVEFRNISELSGAAFYDVSGSVTGATGGVRFKFATRGRFKPYLSVGVLWAKTDLDVKGRSDSPIITPLSTKGGGQSLTMISGLGAEIGLGIQTSLGIEANYFNPPGYNIAYRTTWSGFTNEDAEPRALSLVGLSLGLRYYFEQVVSS